MNVDHHLAVYGSLAPGRSNHGQLAGLAGTWVAGTVRGRLRDNGWGAGLGYPALTLAGDGEAIAVQLFVSADLPAHWAGSMRSRARTIAASGRRSRPRRGW